MSIADKFVKLSEQLMPTGRAWRMRGNFKKLYQALSVSEEKAYNDAVSIRNSILPDNPGFTTDDATDWERRLGLITNLALPLANRSAIILRKLQAPGLRNPARGHYLWIQKQLQDSGFNVYVHENIPTQNPAVLYPGILNDVQQGDFQQGDFQQGGYFNHLVVNSLENSEDIAFNLGSNLRASFIIGGAVLGTAATVPIAREKEFRQQILQLKQAQNVAILFINYI